jgi:hypothetical protein
MIAVIDWNKLSVRLEQTKVARSSMMIGYIVGGQVQVPALYHQL